MKNIIGFYFIWFCLPPFLHVVPTSWLNYLCIVTYLVSTTFLFPLIFIRHWADISGKEDHYKRFHNFFWPAFDFAIDLFFISFFHLKLICLGKRFITSSLFWLALAFELTFWFLPLFLFNFLLFILSCLGRGSLQLVP